MKTAFFTRFFLACIVATLTCGTAFAADPLANFKPKFDPSTAKYTYLLSNVSHPAVEGITDAAMKLLIET